jgi:hypothetical protein
VKSCRVLNEVEYRHDLSRFSLNKCFPDPPPPGGSTVLDFNDSLGFLRGLSENPEEVISQTWFTLVRKFRCVQ